MFLHEIFHQGLKARIANWPTLVLGKPLFVETQIDTELVLIIHSLTSRSSFQAPHVLFSSFSCKP